MAYYCMKTRSNAIRNELTLIFCPFADDLTPCFHTCHCPLDDLQLISADDLQISCASLYSRLFVNTNQSTKKQQNAVTSMLQAQTTKSTRKLYLPRRFCKTNQKFLYIKYKPIASHNFLKLSDENLLIYFIWPKLKHTLYMLGLQIVTNMEHTVCEHLNLQQMRTRHMKVYLLCFHFSCKQSGEMSLLSCIHHMLMLLKQWQLKMKKF